MGGLKRTNTREGEAVCKRIHDVNAWLSGMEVNVRSLTQEMKHLQQLGLQDGTIWLRDGRYAYFLQSTSGDQSGKRVREYLGTDAGRIQRTKEAIARHAKHQDLGRQLKAAKKAIDQLAEDLHEVLEEAKSLAAMQPWLTRRRKT